MILFVFFDTLDTSLKTFESSLKTLDTFDACLDTFVTSDTF